MVGHVIIEVFLFVVVFCLAKQNDRLKTKISDYEHEKKAKEWEEWKKQRKQNTTLPTSPVVIDQKKAPINNDQSNSGIYTSDNYNKNY